MIQEELFKQLNKFDNYTRKINFLNKNLKRISHGSARIVYNLDDNKVIKLAKNKKGNIQNKVEFNLNNFSPEILAKIFENDDAFNWIVMEKASSIDNSEFEENTGLNFEKFVDYLAYIKRKIDPKKYMNIGNKIDCQIKETMINSEFVNKLVTFIKFNDIDIADLYKINTYGLVIRNEEKKLVLVDYGMTNEVGLKYYKIYEKRLLR